MLAYGFVMLWLPKIICYAAIAATLVYLHRLWRRTGNWGFCLLAIVSALGFVLSLTSASISVALGVVWSRAFFAWWSAAMAALGVIAWRKIFSRYASGRPDA
jgi:hypothetical protein